MIPPKRLLLSGGGIKVCAIVGAVKRLYEAKKLTAIKEVCGVSAGAWLAFMLAIKVPIETIERLVSDLDFGVIRNLSAESVMGFPETFGLDDGSKFVNLLETIFRVVLKIDSGLTFADMKTDVQFRCWATDLTMKSPREFSLKATPNVRIIDALRATTAIPVYFTPFTDTITGNMLSDGGIQGNLAIHNLTADERAETWMIGFLNDDEKTGSTPTDIMGFMNSVFKCLIHSRHEDLLKEWNHHILRIPLEFPSWNFEASREDRLNLIKQGYRATEQWLQTPPSRFINRRHSF